MKIIFEKQKNGLYLIYENKNGVKHELKQDNFQQFLSRLYRYTSKNLRKKFEVTVKNLNEFYEYYQCNNRKCFEENFNSFINGTDPTNPKHYESAMNFFNV